MSAVARGRHRQVAYMAVAGSGRNTDDEFRTRRNVSAEARREHGRKMPNVVSCALFHVEVVRSPAKRQPVAHACSPRTLDANARRSAGGDQRFQKTRLFSIGTAGRPHAGAAIS